MISVIIPVLNNIEITSELFETIYKNTVAPSEIILIDNGSTDKYFKLVKKYNKLNINYIRYSENLGVNNAWNEGIRLSKFSYVSILNNDLLLNNFFFQKVIEAMESVKNLGIVVPNIVKEKDLIYKSLDCPIELKSIKKRIGCAFTIRKEVAKKIKPIPIDHLKTYCGDDYLFYFTQVLKYEVKIISNNFVFHYGGKTVHNIFGRNKTKTPRLQEKDFWERIKGSNDENFTT